MHVYMYVFFKFNRKEIKREKIKSHHNMLTRVCFCNETFLIHKKVRMIKYYMATLNFIKKNDIT
ncbi:hypothetical protein PFMALIP_04992 [Plasmodium falciparum MaliPS096_E11]|uniref:Uncharacterized protein n=1 Tax=Plasmodium falciparum MaliPS096_E11 TaxID=1036727 RepID=A0A024WIE9_PLAFA|nr:hypothetical protein PFMALIP_04992 [Plasmodium falciparum MaliPS096_E11]